MPSLTIPDHPLISVVMPVRNAERYVAEAIGSIQAQTYPRWELIVVDSSSDGTPELVEKFAATDSRIRMVSEPPGSRGRASNVALDLAQGELVARMDADDIALPERLGFQLDWMRKTGVEVCGAWSKWFGQRTAILWMPQRHQDIANRLLFDYALLQPTLLTHASILRRHRYSEDATHEGFELFARLAPQHRLGTVPAILLKSRAHSQEVHVVEHEACRADIVRSRRPLFQALYPQADEADFAAVDVVAEQGPAAGLDQLERVGEWVSRFAQNAERMQREWLLDRWRVICGHSAGLGVAAYRTYAVYASRCDAGRGSDASLAAACALHAPYGSRRRRLLAKLRPRRSFAWAGSLRMRADSSGSPPGTAARESRRPPPTPAEARQRERSDRRQMSESGKAEWVEPTLGKRSRR